MVDTNVAFDDITTRASSEESTALMGTYFPLTSKTASSSCGKSHWLTFLCGIIAGALTTLGICGSIWWASSQHVTPVVETTLGDDDFILAGELNGIVPKIQTRLVEFWNDSSFVPTYDIIHGTLSYNDTIEMIEPSWHRLLPERKGFILVTDPARYSLPPSATQDDYGEYWSISAFHQVHCLYMVMQSWLQFHYVVDQKSNAEHILHCFDYVRMGLMCAGDQALEGSDPYLALRGLSGTHGLGSKHVCKDWGTLLEWTDNTTRNEIM
ncbi:hypothetical protein J1614_009605 [Plenodomus biglobosus]|nr:hypothetical protein J1614_009605 [Plenodomus biglobosus]